MADLISRALALEVISAVKGITWSQSGKVLCGKMYSQIKDLPAVNAAPVVHGRLIKYEPDMHGTEPVECSACNYLFARLYPQNYCPNCGAKLDGEQRLAFADQSGAEYADNPTV